MTEPKPGFKQTWKVSLVLFAVLFSIFMATSSAFFSTSDGRGGHLLPSNDAVYTAFPAWTLVHDKSLNIEKIGTEYGLPTGWGFAPKGYLNAIKDGKVIGQQHVDGRFVSDRFPGGIFLAVPFYAIAQQKIFTMTPSDVAAAFATALAMVFLFQMLLALVPRRFALAGTVLFSFGTAVWTVPADALWSESPTLLALSISGWALSRSSNVGAGIGYALAVFSRPHTAVIAATTGIWQSIVQRTLRPVLTIGGISVLGLALLVGYNKINAGKWAILTGSYAARPGAAVSLGSGGQAKPTLWITDYIYTFISPLHGLFVYSPFLLLLIPGLYMAWKATPSWVHSSAVGGLVYLIVQLAGNSYTGGIGFFGYRLIIVPLFLVTPLLVKSFELWTFPRTWARRTFGVLAAVSIWWFAVASVVSAELFGNITKVTKEYTWTTWQIPTAIAQSKPGAFLLATVFVGVVAWLVWPKQELDAAAVSSGSASRGSADQTKSTSSQPKPSDGRKALTKAEIKARQKAKKR
ncbi:unannotated protein [freshwater metagenome]|uniref:Unannotated protein n=1 Tax=freshwater metagenome TaxID=449393 RepID=A0A6J7ECN9_9ZZZZ|nr:hypothetical protein [Actinomycetota bacterium]